MFSLIFMLVILVAGCGPMGEMVQHAGEPTAHVASTSEKSIDQYQLERYDGPKARVAVYRFQDQTAKGGGAVHGGYPGYAYWYNPQIGNGMADMLSDALLQSNRFIVLDRQALKDVLQEQDLAATGRISRETAAPIGQVEGADLLIKGSVTEFQPGSAGGRAGAGLGAFGLPGALIGGVLGGVRQSHVAMIIQVVDARTSRILFSSTVEGKANDFDIGGLLGGFGGGVGGFGGLGTWQKTPVEKAIRIAIIEAVKQLSSKTPQTYFRHGAQGTVAAPAVAPSPARAEPQPSAASYRARSEPPSTAESFTVDSQRIRDAQAMLKQVGLDPGPVDGVWGNKTKAAVAQFQSSRMNLQEPSGRLDETTFAALKQAAAGERRGAISQPVSLQETQPASGTALLPAAVFVKVSRATLLDSSGAEGKPVGSVTEGTKLAVQGEDKDCYFVVAENGTKGWIYKSLTRK